MKMREMSDSVLRFKQQLIFISGYCLNFLFHANLIVGFFPTIRLIQHKDARLRALRNYYFWLEKLVFIKNLDAEGRDKVAHAHILAKFK